MADNTTLPGTGDVIASDDVSGVKYQVVKIDVGGDGASAPLGTANPIPVGGTLLTSLAGTIYNHNAPFVDGSAGQLILGKRRDSDTTTVADGDFNTFNMDEEGRLKVASKPASYAPTVGNVTSATSTVFINTTRFSNLMIHCTGTFAGVNVTFEGSLNSTNGTDGAWFGVQAIRSNANTIETTSGVLAAAPAYAWELSVNALTYFRVRATAWTSGTQVWTMIPGTYATEPIPGAQISGTQPVSGTVGVTGYPTAAASADALANPTITQIGADNMLFNGTSWDRQRGMSTALTTGDTGAKTATGNGATITNIGNKGVQILVNMGAVSGTSPTCVIKVQGSTDAGTTWYDVPGATTASLTATGQYGIMIYPGVATTAGVATTGTTATCSMVIPRTWRVVWTIGGTTPSFTITAIQYIYLPN
jgi:hypothetical protein